MTKDLSIQVCNLLIKDIRRRFFLESFPRISQCLEMLSEDQIWYTPNKSSNSIGNLVLHLEGNLRQYVLSGLGNQMDQRKRDLEFLSSSRINSAQLQKKLTNLEIAIQPVFDSIEDLDLVKKVVVQGFDETVLSILIHVTEHLSYHTGQIAMRTKELLDKDLGFYADFDLNITS